MKFITLSAIAILSLGFLQGVQADVINNVLDGYRSQGASDFSAKSGDALWQKNFADPENSSKQRNCTSCHGEDLTRPGKHVKTGKVIEPLAPSVNKERLTDPKFIEKWFKRNCKWVMGRECTAQEKGDFLLFIQTK